MLHRVCFARVLDSEEMMRMLNGKGRSFVVVCSLFLTEALAGLGIPARAEGTDQDWEKAAVFLGVPGVVSGLCVTAAQEQSGPAEGKKWKFAVVSIRKNNSGGPQHIGVATADGYQMKNLFLGYLLLMAYVPHTGDGAFYSADQFMGMPAWLTGDDDHYDVDAKVDEADLADWQNPAKQPAMLRSMLQAMLEDRLKLVVHRSTGEARVYRLLAGKNGPKLKETNPDELHPGARPMPGGGTLSREQKDDQMTVHYFGISMAQVARFILGDAGRPVEDKTGLAGRYDMTIVKPMPAGAGTPEVKPAESSPVDIANQLGLKLEPAKVQVETLVIDHVERPSPN
jgi:bla regulator protein BlaR1